MKNFFKFMITIGVVFFFFIVYVLLQLNAPHTIQDTSFDVVPGQGINEIATALKDRDIISSTWLFRWYVWALMSDTTFYAGTYTLPTQASIKEIIKLLSTNKTATVEVRTTLIEGWNLSQIGAYLNSVLGFSTEDWLEVVGQVDTERGVVSSMYLRDLVVEYDFLDNEQLLSLEGYVFPDTYLFHPNASVEEVLIKTLNNFDKKITEQMSADIAAANRSLHEVIILASIIEREVLSAEEKKLAASVFYNRLAIGMPLQADSTVNYVTGKTTPSVISQDLEIDSPYNTYKYPGLPPGPISNPGLASIEAAIYPAESEYYYFLTDQDGVAHFSKTFEEHVQKKQQYLR